MDFYPDPYFYPNKTPLTLAELWIFILIPTFVLTELSLTLAEMYAYKTQAFYYYRSLLYHFFFYP